VQRAGGVAAFIDAEHALDVTYARRLRVSLADLLRQVRTSDTDPAGRTHEA